MEIPPWDSQSLPEITSTSLKHTALGPVLAFVADDKLTEDLSSPAPPGLCPSRAGRAAWAAGTAVAPAQAACGFLESTLVSWAFPKQQEK